MIQRPDRAGPSTAALADPELDTGGVPLDVVAFADGAASFFARRAVKRRARIVKEVAEVLRRALDADERVRGVAISSGYGVAVHLFGLLGALFMRRTALVLTDRRLLLIDAGARGRPRGSVSQVPVEALSRARARFGALALELADGKRLSYNVVPGADRSRFLALLPAAPAARRPPAAGPSLQPLCPACLCPVPGRPGDVAACPEATCRAPFADPDRAARLSALAPGLGDLVLGQPAAGAVMFLGATAALGVAAAVVASRPGNASAWVAAGSLVALPRLLSWAMTRHQGRQWVLASQARPVPGERRVPGLPRWTALLVAGAALVFIAVFGAVRSAEERDTRLKPALELAHAGRFEDAMAAYRAAEASGAVDEERRVRFLLALHRAGDLEHADALGRELQHTPIAKALATEFNAAVARENAALADLRAARSALRRGDETAAAGAAERAAAYFRTVKRPALPGSRDALLAALRTERGASPAPGGTPEQ